MLANKLLAFSFVVFVTPAFAQQLSSLDRGRAQDILKGVGEDVRKHYYDAKFHGLDWDAKIAEAKQKIKDAQSFNISMAHIAAMLDTLNDSHTFFLPPEHAYHHDFGWKYQMIGNRCYVTLVRPGSDAETKGVKPGDEILTINGFTPDRGSLWRMQYMFSILRPQPDLRLELQDPSGARRNVDVTAKIREFKHLTDLTGANDASDIWDIVREEETIEHLNRARTAEFGDNLLVLKFPEFSFTPVEVQGIISKARKHKTLILDLRGNGGGSVETLIHLAGGMFEKDVKIADRVGRKESKPVIAKAPHDPFTGKLIVLVDSRSASASELFARTMQLEKRGVVLGDQTAGAVMESRRYSERWGTDTVIFYGVSITDADLIMSDGKSLEHVGVTPDQMLAPSPTALANNRDPVLARAAEIAGVTLSAADAGKLFPNEWPPQ